MPRACLVVLMKVFCLVWFPGIPFSDLEFELILGRDLQMLKRDILENRPPRPLLIQEGQGTQVRGAGEEKQVRKCLNPQVLFRLCAL